VVQSFFDAIENLTHLWVCLRSAAALTDEADRPSVAVGCVLLAHEVMRRTARPCTPATARKSRRHHVESLLELLRDQHTNPHTALTSLSARLGVSHAYLSRLLASETRQPFHVHLAGWRTLHAIVALSASVCSVKEVAYSLGYVGPSEFDRQFRGWLGMTPTQFRRALSCRSATPGALALPRHNTNDRT